RAQSEHRRLFPARLEAALHLAPLGAVRKQHDYPWSAVACLQDHGGATAALDKATHLYCLGVPDRTEQHQCNLRHQTRPYISSRVISFHGILPPFAPLPVELRTLLQQV